MTIDIGTLTEAELIDLQNRIVARLRFLQEGRARCDARVSCGRARVLKFRERHNRPSARLEQRRQAFVRAGVTVEIPADMRSALWMKFLAITPCSGLGALTRMPKGIWWALPATQQMSVQMMHEVMAVAQAREVALPAAALAITLALLEHVPPDAPFSIAVQRLG